LFSYFPGDPIAEAPDSQHALSPPASGRDSRMKTRAALSAMIREAPIGGEQTTLTGILPFGRAPDSQSR
jgi:hypothetical protein